MNRETVFDKVREAIEDLVPNGTPVHRDARLVGNLGLDSLDLAELVADIEDSLSIKVADEELDDIGDMTVDQLVSIVFEKTCLEGVGNPTECECCCCTGSCSRGSGWDNPGDEEGLT